VTLGSLSLTERQAPKNYQQPSLVNNFYLLFCSFSSGQDMNLTGKWKKISKGECDKHYPDEIEFHEHPRFLGKKGPGQNFILWDAGGYAVIDSDRVQIQIATDEQVPYEFSLSGDVLTFTDRDGCEFKYQRLE